MKTRECLICTDIICACPECTDPRSLRQKYGLCRSCTTDLQKLCGERSLKVQSDEMGSIVVKRASREVKVRVVQYLEGLLRERANDHQRRSGGADPY